MIKKKRQELFFQNTTIYLMLLSLLKKGLLILSKNAKISTLYHQRVQDTKRGSPFFPTPFPLQGVKSPSRKMKILQIVVATFAKESFGV